MSTPRHKPQTDSHTRRHTPRCSCHVHCSPVHTFSVQSSASNNCSGFSIQYAGISFWYSVISNRSMFKLMQVHCYVHVPKHNMVGPAKFVRGLHHTKSHQESCAPAAARRARPPRSPHSRRLQWRHRRPRTSARAAAPPARPAPRRRAPPCTSPRRPASAGAARLCRTLQALAYTGKAIGANS